MRVEVPNEVVHSVLEHHALVHQLVEGRELLAGMRAPPEPVSAGFVKRTEDGGNAFLLELEEDFGDAVDVGGERLVHGGERVPVGGALHEAFGEVEFGVGFVRALHVEFYFVAGAPVPRDCRNASLLPDGFGDIDSLFGVFLEPGIVLVRAGGVHQVDADECRVFAAGLENGLHVFVLGGIANGVGVHVTGHHAGDGLFAEVVHEEVVELDGGRSRFCRDGGVAEVELLCLVGLDFDVVHVDPAPALGDGNRVFACGKCKDCFHVGELAFFSFFEGDLGGCFPDADEVDLGVVIVVHVMDDDGVLARLIDGYAGEGDVARSHLDVFSARSVCACGDGGVFGDGGTFGFVLGGKRSCRGDKTGCDQNPKISHSMLLHFSRK